MAIDFYDIDTQIEMNEKALSFYHSSYQKTQTKFSILVVFFTIIAANFVEVSIGLSACIMGELNTFVALVYFLSFLFSVIFVGKAIIQTYQFIVSKEIAYLNEPEYFYKNIRNQYIENGYKDEHELNNLVKNTYLLELEKAVSHNQNVFESKSTYFAEALNSLLLAIIPFTIMYIIHFLS